MHRPPHHGPSGQYMLATGEALLAALAPAA
jgi:hypothetical protein